MDFIDELERLRQMRDANGLTEAEYADAKHALLSRPVPSAETQALAKLDREWLAEVEEYKIKTKSGSYLPDQIKWTQTAALCGIIVFLMGLTIYAFVNKKGMISIYTVIPMAAFTYQLYLNAEKKDAYQAGLAKYEARRSALVDEYARRNGDWS